MPALRHIGATMLVGITIAVLLAPLARRKSMAAVVSPPSSAARLERHDFTTVA
jgi:hypothetical protein